MRSRIQQLGDTLALPLPRAFAEQAGLRHDAEVEVSVVGDTLTVFPVREPGPTLEDLLAEVTEENRHGEVDTGPARGLEVW